MEQRKKTFDLIIRLPTWLTMGWALLNYASVYALNPDGFEQGSHYGYVVARAIIRDDQGNPEWAEYNENGGHTRLPLAGAQLKHAKVIAASHVRALLEQKRVFEQKYSTPTYFTLAEYQQAVAGHRILSRAELPMINLPSVSDDRVLVMIPGKQDRQDIHGDLLEILSFPIDLIAITTISDQAQSLLIDEQGKLLYESEGRLGYLTAFGSFEDNGSVPDSIDYPYATRNLKQFFAPIPGVAIESSAGYINGFDVTNDKGYYRTHYRLSPCPGFAFEYNAYATARLYFQNFNPRGKPMASYHNVRQTFDFCNGLGARPPGFGLSGLMVQQSVRGIVSGQRENVTQVNFPVAVHMMAGLVSIKGVATTDNETQYQAEVTAAEPLLAATDYDGDGVIDDVKRGRLSQGGFVVDDAGDWQGVYLSGQPRQDNQPNFTKKLDWHPHRAPQGLLRKISRKDLANTDIYVFRASTGELITERLGLSDNETTPYATGIRQDSQFYFNMMVRAPEDTRLGFGSDQWNQWQVRHKINPALHPRKADHLRSGEPIRIVAINRATGYMGSALASLGVTQAGGDITTRIPDIAMGPPNLKVWVTRRFNLRGRGQSAEEERHGIANEGAALDSDTLIELHTEWLDTDGRPLPQALEGRGYTARLAKVVQNPGSGSDPLGGTDIHEIAIHPGRHLQLIRFSEGAVGVNHYYFQVNGNPTDRDNDFSSFEHTGSLQYRPRHYVPIKVPLFDEAATAVRKRALQATNDLKQLQPVYHWSYRPELQFTVFDLTIDAVRRQTNNGSVYDIYNAETPIISSDDTQLDVDFNWIAPVFNRLPTLDGRREFILAMGEQEIEFEVVQGNNSEHIVFKNLKHLEDIQPEDYLSLRLFLNQDAENVLWRLAFEHLSIDHLILDEDIMDDEFIYVSADNPVLPLQAYLMGYASRQPQEKVPVTLKWYTQEQMGTFSQPIETDDNTGVFATRLAMPPTAGAVATVAAQLVGAEDVSAFLGHKVKVLPGKAHNIKLTQKGQPAPVGASDWEVTALITDRYGNIVADNTSVDFRLQGEARFKSYDVGTQNGIAKAVITGGNRPGDVQLNIRVNGNQQRIIVQSKPLVLAVEVPETLVTGSRYEVTFKATLSDGTPLRHTEIFFGTDLGTFQQTTGTTNEQGLATVTLATALVPGAGQITGSVGFSQNVKLERQLTTPANASDLDVQRALLIGDVAGAGSARYDSIDGHKVALPYTNQQPILIKGKANETKQVTLGDAFNPNIAPLALYPLNRLDNLLPQQPNASDPNSQSTYTQNVVELTGRYAAKGRDLVIVQGGPLGAPSSIGFTTKHSSIKVEDAADFQKSANTGFRIAFNADSTSAGTLVNLGQGQSLQWLHNQTLAYQIQTTAGIFRVETDPLSQHQWYEVAVAYRAGQIRLQIRGHQRVYSTQATGTITYQQPSLTLGQSFTGAMHQLAFYDWTQAPLVRFAQAKGDGQHQSVKLDDQGNATLQVVSTGHLHANGSQLPMLSVAIQAGNSTQRISLLSEQQFVRWAAPIIEIDKRSALTALTLTQSLPLKGLMNQAYAGWWDISFDEVIDAVKSVASVLIPINELRSIATQIDYWLAKDMKNFDPITLGLDTLTILTYFPVAKALTPVMKTLKGFIKNPKNLKMVAFFSTTIGRRVYEGAKKMDFSKVSDLVYFMLIIADILQDEQARAFIPKLAEIITSEDDMQVWIDFLVKAANGWVDDKRTLAGTDPVLLNLLPDSSGSAHSALPMSGLLSTAFAAKKVTDYSQGQLKGKKIATDLLDIFKGRPISPLKNLADVTRIARAVTRHLRSDAIKVFMSKVEAKNWWTGFISVYNQGLAGLKWLLKGGGMTKNQRVPPALLLSAIILLEKEILAGNISDANAREIYSLIGMSFAEEYGKSSLFGKLVGTRFHLVEVAFWHVNPRYQLKAIEQSHQIDFYMRDALGKLDTFTKKPYNRRTDIVVSEVGAEGEIWVELKSYKRPLNSGFAKHTLMRDYSSNNNRNHKEFFSDFLAGRYNTQLKGLDIFNSSENRGAIWRFHGFKVRDKHKAMIEQGPMKTDLDQIRNKLCEPPHISGVVMQNVIKNSFNDINSLKQLEMKCMKTRKVTIQLAHPIKYLQQALTDAALLDIKRALDAVVINQ